MDIVEKARVFAVAAHAGQKRKYTGEHYHTHLYRVVQILTDFGVKDDYVLATAYLHDTLEDTKVGEYLLLEEFGIRVCAGVLLLTDDMIGNRATRKASDRKRLAGAPAWVQTIKVEPRRGFGLKELLCRRENPRK